MVQNKQPWSAAANEHRCTTYVLLSEVDPQGVRALLHCHSGTATVLASAVPDETFPCGCWMHRNPREAPMQSSCAR